MFSLLVDSAFEYCGESRGCPRHCDEKIAEHEEVVLKVGRDTATGSRKRSRNYYVGGQIPLAKC